MLTVKQLTLICMDLIAAGHADKPIVDIDNRTSLTDYIIDTMKYDEKTGCVIIDFDEIKREDLNGER